jgi:uncharacterized protein (DUF58 family)
LRLRAAEGRAGTAADGGRPGRSAGRVEFKDHRPYAPGDDVRFLDWNAYLRGGGLVTKTFAADDAPTVRVVMDRSASNGPAGSAQDRLARELAGAAGFLCLARGGTARLFALGEGGVRPVADATGPRDAEAWLGALERLPDPAGGAAWDALAQLPPATAPGAASYLVSDLLAAETPTRALAAFGAAARPTVFLVLAHDAPFADDEAAAIAALRDPESGATLLAAGAAEWRAAHAAARAAHAAEVADACARRGAACVPVSARDAFETPLRAARADRP